MSQQLTISSLFSALALVALAAFARADDASVAQVHDTALVLTQTANSQGA